MGFYGNTHLLTDKIEKKIYVRNTSSRSEPTQSGWAEVSIFMSSGGAEWISFATGCIKNKKILMWSEVHFNEAS